MIAISRINWNCEIWRKLLNSVAGKYDCGVNFSIHGGQFAVPSTGWTGEVDLALLTHSDGGSEPSQVELGLQFVVDGPPLGIHQIGDQADTAQQVGGGDQGLAARPPQDVQITAAVDRPEAQEAFGIQARNLVRLHEAGIPIAFGTDGSAPWAVHQELEDMTKARLVSRPNMTFLLQVHPDAPYQSVVQVVDLSFDTQVDGKW